MYDLELLASELSVNLDHSGTLLNERLAEECIKSMANACKIKIKTLHNREVQLTSKVPPLCVSTHERADVVVYDEAMSKVILLIEVQSSPMLFSERKATLGAADMIRFLRNSDSTFTEFTSFVFPKIGVHQCIIQIRVKWETLKFSYSLKRLLDMKEAVAVVQDVLRNQWSSVPALPRHVDDNHLILLSQDDLTWFSTTNPQQVPSYHNIVVTDSCYIYKVVKDLPDYCRLLKLHLACVLAGRKPTHFVVAKADSAHPTLVMYPKVLHNPLQVDSASKCLRTLVHKIKAALDELHETGFTHNDVRLPNICFDDKLEAVLIDLDRCVPMGESSWFVNFASCMYQRPPHAGKDFCWDFMQLGWMLAWILCPTGDYHSRVLEDIPHDIRSDPFISDLLTQGVYSQEKLSCSTILRDHYPLGSLVS